MKYQTDYTSNPVAERSMYDAAGRTAKASKIVAVLADHCGDLSRLRALDVSCSTGIMARHLAGHFREVVGIDIDETAVSYARENNTVANTRFLAMDALNTDFAPGHFDVVVCNQMYEHVPDAQALLDEIHRVLAPGGVCYFGATNRLKVIETHYGRLPFLSYLPKPLANAYLRLLGRGDTYYESLHTVWTLKRLCRRFDIIDYTSRVVRNPQQFHATDMITPDSKSQRLALAVLRYAYWFSPGYIWLLEKRPDA